MHLAIALAAALTPAPARNAAPASAGAGSHVGRRALFALPILCASPLTQCGAVLAAPPALELTTYRDAQYGDNFLVPQAWSKTEQDLPGGRRLVAMADPQDSNSNVFLLYTPIAADYTSLGRCAPPALKGTQARVSKCHVRCGDPI